MRVLWHVGDVVRKLREDRNWKQDKLAEKAGLHLVTIGRVEAGHETKSATIAKLAKALDVTIAELHRLVPAPTDELPVADDLTHTRDELWHRLDPEGRERVLKIARGVLNAGSLAPAPGDPSRDQPPVPEKPATTTQTRLRKKRA